MCNDAWLLERVGGVCSGDGSGGDASGDGIGGGVGGGGGGGGCAWRWRASKMASMRRLT